MEAHALSSKRGRATMEWPWRPPSGDEGSTKGLGVSDAGGRGNGASDVPPSPDCDRRSGRAASMSQPFGLDAGAHEEQPSASGSAVPSTDYNTRLEAELLALLQYSRCAAQDKTSELPGNSEAGEKPPEGHENMYRTLNTTILAHYEELQDYQRAAKMSRPSNNKRRKHKKSGEFNTSRLRALEKYLLSANGPGMSSAGMDHFFNFMKKWEKPSRGKGRKKRVDECFKSAHALKTAVNADLDAAMESAGWLQCEFMEGGVWYEAYFLPVLDVMMQMVREAKNVKFWSGSGGPAQPTTRRETPMDGDVFRLFEKDVCDQGADNFVLGFHVYSDSHVLSGSGGTCCFVPHEPLRVLSFPHDEIGRAQAPEGRGRGEHEVTSTLTNSSCFAILVADLVAPLLLPAIVLWLFPVAPHLWWPVLATLHFFHSTQTLPCSSSNHQPDHRQAAMGHRRLRPGSQEDDRVSCGRARQAAAVRRTATRSLHGVSLGSQRQSLGRDCVRQRRKGSHRFSAVAAVHIRPTRGTGGVCFQAGYVWAPVFPL